MTTAPAAPTIFAPAHPDLAVADLRAFVAVVGEGGIAAAARLLRRGEADVVDAVRRLEAHTGRPLLKDGWPTPEGARLLDNARRLIILHDETVRCVGGAPEELCPAAGPSPEEMCEAVRLRTLLADAVGCVSEGFVLFDEDGRLVMCNARYRAAYPLLADLLRPGVRFAELLRAAVERGGAGGEVDDPGTWVEERLRRHTRTDAPTDHRLGDGRWYRISEHATRTGGVVKILTDITELKSHEEALAESEARYRRLVEMAPYGIVVWDGGRVRYANAMAARMFGSDDPAAMAAIPTLDGENGEDGDGAEAGGARLFDRLPPPSAQSPFAAPLDVRIAVPGGDAREVEVGVHPFAVPGGPAWFLVFNDVTARKQAERALNQAQKMQAIGQLAGGVAHEFNNMLTAIGGFAQMARRAPNDRPRVEQCLTEIVKATERAAGLTAELLSFGRRGRAEAARPVRVADRLEDLERFLRPILGERHSVRAEVRCADAVVLIEPPLLHQTLVNLAINGRDAMPDGGVVTVTVDRMVPDAAFRQRHAGLTRGAYVTLAVRDTGCGMTPDVAERVFEPFFTTKAQGEGTGLGLSLVYSTVTRAGGAVEVESEPGRGTTVTLYLPAEGGEVVEDADEGPGLDDEVADDGLSMAVTVLLVEDEAQVRDFIRLTLEDMGMRVVTASDGPEALDAFAAHGGAFDLMVTDLVMPRMSGAEVARSLRRDCPDLPVVLISGYPPERENLDDLLAAGRQVAFLHKPINPDALAETVQALIL